MPVILQYFGELQHAEATILKVKGEKYANGSNDGLAHFRKLSELLGVPVPATVLCLLQKSLDALTFLTKNCGTLTLNTPEAHAALANIIEYCHDARNYIGFMALACEAIHARACAVAQQRDTGTPSTPSGGQ